MGLKKIIKKVGKGVKKAAPLIMAGLAAKALMGRKKGNVANTANMENIGNYINKRPINIADDYNYKPRIPEHPSDIQSIPGGGSAPMTWRRRINKAIGTNFKKGGSVKKAKVTGAAKRGFGRALMKGKK